MEKALTNGAVMDSELNTEHLASVLHSKTSISYDVHLSRLDGLTEVLLVCSHTGSIVASGIIEPDGTIDPAVYPEALSHLLQSCLALSSRMVFGRQSFTLDGRTITMGQAFKGLHLWFMATGYREALKNFFDYGPMTDTTRAVSATCLKEFTITSWERKSVKNRDRLLAFSRGGPISPIGGSVPSLKAPMGHHQEQGHGTHHYRASR